MALPKIKQPLFSLEIPSTKQIVRYRSFTVAEEKLLLIAKESSELSDIINVYKQIINNCIVDDINVDSLAYFDLEYIFLMLRSKSVSNIVEIQVTDDDESKYQVEINLDDVKVTEQTVDKLIEIDDSIKVMMTYPSYESLLSLQSNVNDSSLMLNVVRDCISQIYEGEEVYETSNYTTSEMDDFVMSLRSKDLLKIQKFFEDLPRVYADIKYRNRAGVEKEIRLEGMQSFFA
jgi:uncharacterized protein YfkK (UPF0435 family)